MKTCLSCDHSEPFAPKCCRSTVQYRFRVFGHRVDQTTIPGKTIGCDRFKEPDVPFAWPSAGDEDMPAELL